MRQPSPIAPEGPYAVLEGQPIKWTGTLKDEDGDVVPLSELLTLTLTLALPSGAVINSRDDLDAKNANDVTVHATSGLVTWRQVVADVAMSDENQTTELHRATFKFTWNDGVAARQGIHVVDFWVQNIKSE